MLFNWSSHWDFISCEIHSSVTIARLLLYIYLNSWLSILLVNLLSISNTPLNSALNSTLNSSLLIYSSGLSLLTGISSYLSCYCDSLASTIFSMESCKSFYDSSNLSNVYFSWLISIIFPHLILNIINMWENLYSRALINCMNKLR